MPAILRHLSFLMLASTILFTAATFSIAAEPTVVSSGMSWVGNESAIATLLQTAVTTNAEWTDLWKRAFGKDAPAIDFGRYFVACAFLGHEPGWWYSIHFDEPVVEGKSLVVPFTLVMLQVDRGPAKDPFGKDGFHGQYAMKAFPRIDGVDNIVIRGRSPEGDFPG